MTTSPRQPTARQRQIAALIPAGLQPGFTLYRLWVQEQLGYVGQTAMPLPARLSNHAGVQPWWPLITSCTVELLPSMDELVAAEFRAIVMERPWFNVRHRRVLAAAEHGPQGADGLTPEERVFFGIGVVV